ncbi:MAG: tRNA-specific adenosine deaminase [Planctomycetes bacterium RBG_16_55_9]|nr:MAG: tRNA-specific adenosine deaminase [Planctomycetes bacterium RBG_16_55_9]
MSNIEVILQLPDWVEHFLSSSEKIYPTAEDRMRLVIRLAQLNIERKTGGPFGAAIFECNSSRLISVGVNCVESLNCSIAHAEMLAIATAQRMIGSYDLGSQTSATYELVTSTEPCAMCLGAIPWSGVRSVVCGARDRDARAIGFDEGAKPHNWIRALEDRGIRVRRDVLREHAKAVLVEYVERGGLIYNARKKETSR